MPSPKDGTAQTLVGPAAPRTALDADNANPGDVESVKAAQQQSGTGKYGSTQAKSFKGDSNGSTDPTTKKTWIEILLVDDKGTPVPGESYAITLPDGTVSSGTLDEKGLARVEGIDPGSCQVTFPDLDGQAWKPA